MIRHETDGSYWWFDEATKTYRRTPKDEKPREHLPHYSNHPSLQDLQPHAFLDWIRTERCLVILLNEEGETIYAPINGGATNAEYLRLKQALLKRNL